MSPAASARALRCAEAALVALLVVLFYHTHLDLSRIQSGGDFANLFWPIKEMRLDALRSSGVFALWNPYTFMGSPLAATMQHAIFYPPEYVFFLRSPLLAAMNLYLLAHLALTGIGTWWAVRRGLEAGALAAILAGSAFPCTAWFWGAQEHVNQIAAVAWMPWLLGLALARARDRINGVSFVAWYGVAGGLQLLVGHPQAAFYTHAFAGLIVIAGAMNRASGDRLGAAARNVGLLAAGGALTGLIGGVQLLPALELTRMASRHQLDPNWSFSFSMPPDILRTYVQPHAFGSFVEGYADRRAYNEYGLFVGVPTLVLGVWGAIAARRRFGWFAVVGILLACVMAMGGNVSPARIAAWDFTEFPSRALGVDGARLSDVSLHDLLVTVVPTMEGFRVPARILIVAALLWCILAGLGAESITRRLQKKNAGVLAGAVLVALVWLALLIPSRPEKFRHPVERAPLELAYGEDLARVGGRSLDDRLFRLTVGDDALLIAERQLEWQEEVGENPIEVRWLRLFENNNAAIFLPSMEGYEEGLLPTFRSKDFVFAFNRHFRSGEPDRQLLALLGVSRVFSDLPVNLPPDRAASLAARPMYRVPDSHGAAFWAAQAEGIDFAKLEGTYWPRVGMQGERSDSLRTYGSAPNWNAPLPLLRTDVTNPNRVRITSDGAVDGDAILSMGWYPDWRFADGTPVEWLGAVHASVPRGQFHEGVAELLFRPRAHRVGLFLGMIGAALAAALMMVGCRACKGGLADAAGSQ